MISMLNVVIRLGWENSKDDQQLIILETIIKHF